MRCFPTTQKTIWSPLFHHLSVQPDMQLAPGAEDSLANLIGARVAKNHFGEHLALRNWFSTPEFSAPSAVTLKLLSRTRNGTLSRRTRAALEDPSKWLFLDTETTTLAGVMYPFLVGIASWDAGGLQVEQLFLRDFSEEHSLLRALADRLTECPVLLTFNGKAFDWPLLENRFAMTRSIKPPQLAAHLDLLHPARALWKLRLGSVRLVELERRVLDAPRLGWNREDDIASALIPQYYFDYIRGGACEPLIGVIRHNQMDLRGLAALFGKINGMLASDDEREEDVKSLDLLGLSRFLTHCGDSHRAQVACSQAFDIGLPAGFRPRATRELAQLSKRCGNHDAAAALWQELATESHGGVVACEQLAIHYERRAKDLVRAAEFASLGLAKLRRIQANSHDPYAAARASRLMKKFVDRITRLQGKTNVAGTSGTGLSPKGSQTE
jgi:uncharacterized protein YprB with RNaseH-like and TPR domain